MTRTVIIGGGGMVGQKLAHRLFQEDPKADLTLFDIGFPDGCIGSQRELGDLSQSEVANRIAGSRFDTIYQLASIVSGDAEANFDKGWDINLGGMSHLLAALRREHEASKGVYRPKVIFTSSIAVFGGPFPDKIDDDFLCSPQTSYGAQKAMCEVLLQDYSRKGFVSGLSLRLPTICVRPGAPNLAASSFFSGIIREPLNGQEAILPVSDTVRHWHASPRSAAGFLAHAATLTDDQIGIRRSLNLPGVSCTVAEQIEALRDIAGQETVDRIKIKRDDGIARIVEGWPRNFDPQRALDLGFEAEKSFREIIETYIADDMPPSPRQTIL